MIWGKDLSNELTLYCAIHGDDLNGRILSRSIMKVKRNYHSLNCNKFPRLIYTWKRFIFSHEMIWSFMFTTFIPSIETASYAYRENIQISMKRKNTEPYYRTINLCSNGNLLFANMQRWKLKEIYEYTIATLWVLMYRSCVIFNWKIFKST